MLICIFLISLASAEKGIYDHEHYDRILMVTEALTIPDEKLI